MARESKRRRGKGNPAAALKDDSDEGQDFFFRIM